MINIICSGAVCTLSCCATQQFTMQNSVKHYFLQMFYVCYHYNFMRTKWCTKLQLINTSNYYQIISILSVHCKTMYNCSSSSTIWLSSQLYIIAWKCCSHKTAKLCANNSIVIRVDLHTTQEYQYTIQLPQIESFLRKIFRQTAPNN